MFFTPAVEREFREIEICLAFCAFSAVNSRFPFPVSRSPLHTHSPLNTSARSALFWLSEVRSQKGEADSPVLSSGSCRLTSDSCLLFWDWQASCILDEGAATSYFA
jgi:hypothetical protein